MRHSSLWDVAALIQTRDLDLLQLGEETAASLGVNVESSKRLLTTTSSGSATPDGKDLHPVPHNELARRMAFVPQDTHVDFAHTVAEILAIFHRKPKPTMRRFALPPNNAMSRIFSIGRPTHFPEENASAF